MHLSQNAMIGEFIFTDFKTIIIIVYGFVYGQGFVWDLCKKL